MQGGLVRFGRSYALVKQVTREGPLEVWVRIGTPLGGDIQRIYPMERPAAIAGPFSLADSVENLRPGRSQARKPDPSPAQTMQISKRCAQEHQSYPPPHGQNAHQSRM
jgi:hypothetical protein